MKYVFKMYKMMVYNCPIIATSKPFPLFPDLPPSLRHLKGALPPYNKDIRFKINTLDFRKLGNVTNTRTAQPITKRRSQSGPHVSHV